MQAATAALLAKLRSVSASFSRPLIVFIVLSNVVEAVRSGSPRYPAAGLSAIDRADQGLPISLDEQAGLLPAGRRASRGAPMNDPDRNRKTLAAFAKLE